MNAPGASTTTSDRPAGRTWASAADRLARAATRRGRVEAFGRPAAALLAGSGALVLLGRALRLLDGVAAIAVLGAGAVAAVLVGARAAARAPVVSRGAAAWALDRLGGARERGLTAAMLGDAHARTVRGEALPPPPAARLRPADGTAFVVGAALVPLAALLWPGPAESSPAASALRDDAAQVRGVVSGAAAAASAAQADDAARTADAEAATERRIRDALGVAPRDPLDVATLSERLADPAVRQAALAAAPPGSPAAAALSSRDPAAVEALARALDAEAASRAEALRRDAAAQRARVETAPIPPERRALVARYLSSSSSTTAPPR